MPLRDRFRTRVVGLTFGPDGERYAARVYRAVVADQAPLRLTRQPGAGRDPYAIAVERDDTGEHIGYIRAKTARALAPHIDVGELWVVQTVDLEIADGREERPGLMLTLRHIVWADDPPIVSRQAGSGTSRAKRPPPDFRQWGRRALHFANEAGLRAVRVGPDVWAVPSGSYEDRWYSVVVDVDPHRLVRCLCHCKGAACRPELPVACRHAGAVIQELARRGEARMVGGLAYQIPPAIAQGA